MMYKLFRKAFHNTLVIIHQVAQEEKCRHGMAYEHNMTSNCAAICVQIMTQVKLCGEKKSCSHNPLFTRNLLLYSTH